MKKMFENIYTFVDLNNKLDEMEDNDNYYNWKNIASNYEEKCIKYINDRNKATTTDINDEIDIEEEFVNSAIKEIIREVR